METALIFLIWALFFSVIILTMIVGVHLSARTDRVTAQAESIRADTKRSNGGR